MIIKHNKATECCITNGAEGEVVSWISRPIADGKNALKTLFICLICIAHPISLGASGSKYTDCYLLAKNLLTLDTFRPQFEY